jgi:hypothetical protein
VFPVKKVRAKQTIVALLTAGLLTIQASVVLADNVIFRDVPAEFWGRKHIEWAVDQKIADGYPDGTFKPDAAINRNEFLAMLIRAYQPADLEPGTEGPDWADPYLRYAARLGWSLAQPGELAFDRGHAAQYLANASGKSYSTDDSILYLLDAGLSDGKNGRSLAGYDKAGTLTRAEAVTFIERFKSKHPELQAAPAKEEKYVQAAEFNTYKARSFTILLPESWNGKYEVAKALHGDGITENYDFISTANKAAAGGVIFTVTVWTTDTWRETGEEMSQDLGLEVIAKTADSVFTLRKASDVQYNPDDPALEKEYHSMSSDILAGRYSILPGADQEKPAGSAEAPAKLTEKEGKAILNRLIPEAEELYGMFNGTGAFQVDKSKTIPGQEGYALVTDEAFKTVADLKKAVEAVFTKELAEAVFYSRYLTPAKGDRPLYQDYEGKLYNDTRNGGHGWATAYLIDTAKLISQKDNAAELVIDTTVLDDPADPLTVRIEYVNGKWLLASRLD